MGREERSYVLVIAGLDPSGGAGLLADVRTLAEHGVGALGAVTALTEQGPSGLSASHPVEPELVARQVRSLLAEMPVHAVKVGMLGRARTAMLVGEVLIEAAQGPRYGREQGLRVVFDPVFRATHGTPLIEEDADGTWLDAVRALLPAVTLLTPNVPEAARLAGTAEPTSLEDAAALCRRLLRLGAKAVLLKGGHLPASTTGQEVVDLLLQGPGEPLAIRGPRITGAHGTGCVLSSAIAAHLALGHSLEEATVMARRFLEGRLRTAIPRGKTRYLF